MGEPSWKTSRGRVGQRWVFRSFHFISIHFSYQYKHWFDLLIWWLSDVNRRRCWPRRRCWSSVRTDWSPPHTSWSMTMRTSTLPAPSSRLVWGRTNEVTWKPWVELLPQCDLYVVFKIPMLRNQSSNCVEKCYEIFEIVTVSNIFAMSYDSLKWIVWVYKDTRR